MLLNPIWIQICFCLTFFVELIMAEVTLYITIDPIPITSIEFKNENYRKWKRSNSVSYDFGAILIIHLADWHPPWIFLVRYTIHIRKNCQQNQNAITLISMIKSCMSNCRFNYSRKQPLNEMQIDSSCNQIFLYITSDWHLSIYSNLLQYYFEQNYLSITFMNTRKIIILEYYFHKI